MWMLKGDGDERDAPAHGREEMLAKKSCPLENWHKDSVFFFSNILKWSSTFDDQPVVMSDGRTQREMFYMAL